jgi:hypothetical protein
MKNFYNDLLIFEMPCIEKIIDKYEMADRIWSTGTI